MSDQTAVRKPCDCGERDHLESELERSRGLVRQLDVSGERTDEALRSARARIAHLESALRLIADGSPPDEWKWKETMPAFSGLSIYYQGYGTRGEQDHVAPVNSGEVVATNLAPSARNDPEAVHVHGIAVGAWMAAKLARAALKQEKP